MILVFYSSSSTISKPASSGTENVLPEDELVSI
jgi:hypothetical protein